MNVNVTSRSAFHRVRIKNNLLALESYGIMIHHLLNRGVHRLVETYQDDDSRISKDW